MTEVERKVGQPLKNPRWERFCRFFVFGSLEAHDDLENAAKDPIRGNASASYKEAGYRTKGHAARNSAHRLMKDTRIRERIGELRDEQQRIALLSMDRWKSMLLVAQQVLAKAMRGEAVNGAQLRAAEIVIDQAIGPSRLRFGVDLPADEGGLQVHVFGSRFEPRGDPEEWRKDGWGPDGEPLEEEARGGNGAQAPRFTNGR